MKNIIDLQVKARKVSKDISSWETDLLAVGMFSETKRLDKFCRELDGYLGGAIKRLVELGDFKGKEGESSLLYAPEEVGFKRVLLVGLGKKEESRSTSGLDTIRKAAGAASYKAVSIKAEMLSLAFHLSLGGRFNFTDLGQVCAEGAYFGAYRYDEFVTDDEQEEPRLAAMSVEVIDSDAGKVGKLRRGVEAGVIIGESQSYARTIANRPGNVINPETLAEEAKKMARGRKNLSCTVFDEKHLKDKGMGGVLAVGSGSQSEPRFIVLKYKPNAKKAGKLPTVGLVGKAITFDSGGISIKPSRGMDEMKLDKCGGIAVLSVMRAVSELNLPINVYGIIPSAENMPSGSSYRPGDIVTTYSGKTVEIGNTDAEGRMILCDGLHYAAEEGCDVIIDIATLTGACKVALGKYMAGLMGSGEKVKKQLQKASERSGEKVWPMPSGEEYAKEMKSKIADLKNIGSRWGGACTAAAFLGNFVGEKDWAHIDMAGVDMFEKESPFQAVGASGFGVRLITTYLMGLCGR